VTALLILLNRRFQCLFSRVQQRVLQWTRPTSRSLFAGTLNDLARTRTELITENALLRQQLIILRRQVKHPACTRTDRLLLVVLARAARNWTQALFICAARYPPRLASSGVPLVLEATLQACLNETQNPCRDHHVDRNAGAEQSLVGCGAHSWRTAQTGHSGF
jgi:hypothetical protein